MSESSNEVQHFLDRFHRNRIGMRMLIAHHIALHRQINGNDFVGIVNKSTDPAEVASDAAVDAANVCQMAYGFSPRVEIKIPDTVSSPTFVFVPGHLHHILFEILKNAMRATVEREELRVGLHNIDPDKLNPINIWISEENEGNVGFRFLQLAKN